MPDPKRGLAVRVNYGLLETKTTRTETGRKGCGAGKVEGARNSGELLGTVLNLSQSGSTAVEH